MTEMEIAVKMENHEQQIKSLKHRMDEQEEQCKNLNNLAMSVQELALNMKQMIEEQKTQGERLAKLESEPADKWNMMTEKIFTAIVSAIGGGIAVALAQAILPYIK